MTSVGELTQLPLTSKQPLSPIRSTLSLQPYEALQLGSAGTSLTSEVMRFKATPFSSGPRPTLSLRTLRTVTAQMLQSGLRDGVRCL